MIPDEAPEVVDGAWKRHLSRDVRVLSIVRRDATLSSMNLDSSKLRLFAITVLLSPPSLYFSWAI